MLPKVSAMKNYLNMSCLRKPMWDLLEACVLFRFWGITETLKNNWQASCGTAFSCCKAKRLWGYLYLRLLFHFNLAWAEWPVLPATKAKILQEPLIYVQTCNSCCCFPLSEVQYKAFHSAYPFLKRHGNITFCKGLFKVGIVSWGVPFMSTFLKAVELTYDFVVFCLT